MHACLAALANPRRRIERVIATRNAAQRLPAPIAGLQLLEPAAMDGMLPPGAVHQGLAVRAEPPEPAPLGVLCASGGPLLMLDGVTDPQNVGAAFRAAAAFGAQGVILQDRKSPPLGGALAKAAAGAVDLVAHARVTNLARALEEIAAGGFHTVALAGDAEATIAAALADPRPLCLVVGAEGKGVRPSVRAACESAARIPIAAAMESLNVATAAAVALYAASARTY